jgi:hypothetical protein
MASFLYSQSRQCSLTTIAALIPVHIPKFQNNILPFCRSQWPHSLRGASAAACLLGMWVWIPPGAWMSVPFECCVLSSRGLSVGLITRTEESCWVWRCVWVWSWSLDNEEILTHYGLLNIFCLWLCSPARAMASSFTRFRDHTQRRATVDRTLLDE